MQVAQAPDMERYIIACHTEEQRRQLADLLAATLPPPPPQYLTESMPLLVGAAGAAALASHSSLRMSVARSAGAAAHECA